MRHCEANVNDAYVNDNIRRDCLSRNETRLIDSRLCTVILFQSLQARSCVRFAISLFDDNDRIGCRVIIGELLVNHANKVSTTTECFTLSLYLESVENNLMLVLYYIYLPCAHSVCSVKNFSRIWKIRKRPMWGKCGSSKRTSESTSEIDFSFSSPIKQNPICNNEQLKRFKRCFFVKHLSRFQTAWIRSALVNLLHFGIRPRKSWPDRRPESTAGAR